MSTQAAITRIGSVYSLLSDHLRHLTTRALSQAPARGASLSPTRAGGPRTTKEDKLQGRESPERNLSPEQLEQPKPVTRNIPFPTYESFQYPGRYCPEDYDPLPLPEYARSPGTVKRAASALERSQDRCKQRSFERGHDGDKQQHQKPPWQPQMKVEQQDHQQSQQQKNQQQNQHRLVQQDHHQARYSQWEHFQQQEQQLQQHQYREQQNQQAQKQKQSPESKLQQWQMRLQQQKQKQLQRQEQQQQQQQRQKQQQTYQENPNKQPLDIIFAGKQCQHEVSDTGVLMASKPANPSTALVSDRIRRSNTPKVVPPKRNTGQSQDRKVPGRSRSGSVSQRRGGRRTRKEVPETQTSAKNGAAEPVLSSLDIPIHLYVALPNPPPRDPQPYRHTVEILPRQPPAETPHNEASTQTPHRPPEGKIHSRPFVNSQMYKNADPPILPTMASPIQAPPMHTKSRQSNVPPAGSFADDGITYTLDLPVNPPSSANVRPPDSVKSHLSINLPTHEINPASIRIPTTSNSPAPTNHPNPKPANPPSRPPDTTTVLHKSVTSESLTANVSPIRVHVAFENRAPTASEKNPAASSKRPQMTAERLTTTAPSTRQSSPSGHRPTMASSIRPPIGSTLPRKKPFVKEPEKRGKIGPKAFSNFDDYMACRLQPRSVVSGNKSSHNKASGRRSRSGHGISTTRSSSEIVLSTLSRQATIHLLTDLEALGGTQVAEQNPSGDSNYCGSHRGVMAFSLCGIDLDPSLSTSLKDLSEGSMCPNIFSTQA